MVNFFNARVKLSGICSFHVVKCNLLHILTTWCVLEESDLDIQCAVKPNKLTTYVNNSTIGYR